MTEDRMIKLARGLAEGTVGAALGRIRPAQGGRRSAVLALLTDEHVLLQQRGGGLRKHAGQVAFPGGAVEPGESDREAALREAWEETGLDVSAVRVLGEFAPTHIPVSGFDVTTVVGWAPETSELVPGDAVEVAGVHWVAIADLADPANRFTAVHPVSGFRTPGFDVDGLFVWGFTAFVLDELLRGGGWARAWDAERREPVPAALAGTGHRAGMFNADGSVR